MHLHRGGPFVPTSEPRVCSEKRVGAGLASFSRRALLRSVSFTDTRVHVREPTFSPAYVPRALEKLPAGPLSRRNDDDDEQCSSARHRRGAI